VIRTNQSLPICKKEGIYDVMTVILFIYAKKHMELAYKQGMHELLAILLQVHYECCQAFAKCLEPHSYDALASVVPNEQRRLVVAYNDIDFLEHDVYWLFEKVMEKMWNWYYVPAVAKLEPSERGAEKRPFEGHSAAAEKLSPAAHKLRTLWNCTLRSRDSVLYDHLQLNDVLPTTFGTGWTRLLFSRQFPADFLVLWDAIVASEFSLVEPVVVAMIVAIRRLLLDGDNCKCNVLLVSKYPQAVDVRYVLALALHLKWPDAHAQPRRSPFKFSIPYLQEISKGNGDATTGLGKKLLKPIAEVNAEIKAKLRGGDNLASRANERKMVELAGATSEGDGNQHARESSPEEDDQFEVIHSPAGQASSIADFGGGGRLQLLQWKQTLELGSEALATYMAASRKASASSEAKMALSCVEAVVRDMEGHLSRLQPRQNGERHSPNASVAVDALELNDQREEDDDDEGPAVK